ncbi:MAG TPA: hypothetical protein PLP94_03100 [Candidatus Saccharicenans sp.]|jgi:hypothetical protein|nr:hypothetical protein [Candidatus Saccharicenans sp.]HOJ26170.1 hypothetical protein [Candidatus Saccharicenans sp.]HOL44963.1 hypothetical protein [Candidatus Saccharicenans sp.]HOM93615.1 hypothetical protein [Candidatus Saccharicenans sp.]HOT68259.1 hypothetical protein [Candidatus Saccharicenans sp.]
MIAKIIMVIYYLICLFFTAITIKNLIEEKTSKDKVVLYLITLIPFIARLLRLK